MPNYDSGLATAVVGVAVFQVAQLWRDVAPSLGDLRGAEPGDIGSKQRLVDADVVVGLVAVMAGVGVALLTKDYTALIMILFTFGVLSIYYHQVAAAPSR